MGQKAFDILPPYPKDEPRNYHHHGSKTKKEKVKSQHTFLLFMFGLFLIFILFGLSKLDSFTNNISSTPTVAEPSTPKPTSSSGNFELFDNQGQSNLTGTSESVSVRLLDGTTKVENITTIKDLLLKNGYIIEKQDKATNTYSQTMIYYKKGQLVQGQDATDVLKTSFSPQLQESSALDKSYDLLIIVGDK